MNKYNLTIVLLGALSLIGTTSCEPDGCNYLHWGYSYQEFEHYDVNADHITPDGTLFDPTGQSISPLLIDRLTGEVSDCLLDAFPDKILPSSVTAENASYCNKNTLGSGTDHSLDLPLDKTSIMVKIPNDWVYSCDGTQQLLPTPVIAGGEGCSEKGLDPDEFCPCRWRAGIKCPNIMITPPSFYLFKDALIRYLTGCSNPWASPELAKCANPTTLPLSNGSDPRNGLK